MRPKEAEFSSQFTVIGPPTIVTTTPAPGARFGAPIPRCRHHHHLQPPMDEKSVTDRVAISPPHAEPALRLGGEQAVRLRRDAALDSVPGGAATGPRDKLYGLEMKEGYDWSFTITRMAPSLGLVDTGRYGQFAACEPQAARSLRRQCQRGAGQACSRWICPPT